MEVINLNFEVNPLTFRSILKKRQEWHGSSGASSTLKVSKSQKQILKFSFEPKNEPKYFCISALASKMGQIKKQMQVIILDDR